MATLECPTQTFHLFHKATGAWKEIPPNKVRMLSTGSPVHIDAQGQIHPLQIVQHNSPLTLNSVNPVARSSANQALNNFPVAPPVNNTAGLKVIPCNRSNITTLKGPVEEIRTETAEIQLLQHNEVTSSLPVSKMLRLVLGETPSAQVTDTMSQPLNQRTGSGRTRRMGKNKPGNKSPSPEDMDMEPIENSDSMDKTAEHIINSIEKKMEVMDSRLSRKIEGVHTSMNNVLTDQNKSVITRSLSTEVHDNIQPRLSKLENAMSGKKKGLLNRVQNFLFQENADPELAEKYFLAKEPLDAAVTVDNIDEMYDYVDKQTTSLAKRVTTLEQQRERDQKQISVLADWADVLYHENKTHQSQLEKLQATLYQNDLEMVGVREVAKESPKASALKFFKNVMKLSPENSDIVVAYRKGGIATQTIPGKKVITPRCLVVTCTPTFRSTVLKNVNTLDKLTDAKDGFKFFVGPPLPEVYKAAKDRYKPELKVLRDKNEGKPIKDQTPYYMMGIQLVVNNVVRKEFLTPPPFLRESSEQSRTVSRNLRICRWQSPKLKNPRAVYFADLQFELKTWKLFSWLTLKLDSPCLEPLTLWWLMMLLITLENGMTMNILAVNN